MRKPDYHAYARKHAHTARRKGLTHAAKNALTEAGLYALNQAEQHVGTTGRRIWACDWDICLVVDACRYDQWCEVAPDYNWLTAESGWSVGSASPEWYGETFHPDTLPDGESLGVVTANPFAGKPEGRIPHLLDDATPVDRHDAVTYTDYVYEDVWGCNVDGGYLDVTHPGVVTDRAYQAWTDHDLDRLVVHYMQPRLPFRSRPELFGRWGNLDDFGEVDDKPYASGGKEIWKQIRDGERDRDAVWDAYCDNLEWVLDDINRLREAVAADMLITSDHGNAIGEWGLWSHPPGAVIPELRRVPWVKVTGTGASAYTPSEDAVDDSGTGGQPPVEDKLRALGYR